MTRCLGGDNVGAVGSVQAPRQDQKLHELLKEVQVFTRDSDGGVTRDCELDSAGGSRELSQEQTFLPLVPEY